MHFLTFRLSIFGDFSRFTPTTANTIAWTQALQKAGYNYLPSIFQTPQQVVNMPFLSVQLGASDNRMQFVSPTGDTIIRILSERLDVELTQGVSDKPDAYLKEKLDFASKIIRLMLSALGTELRGTRLAYYVDALIPEPTDKAFNSFYQKFNLGISMNNKEDECSEWNHRFNRRIFIDVGTDHEEKCNAIFSLESGLLQTGNLITKEQQTIKGLHLAADINTLAENSVERFTIDNLDAFVTNAQDVYLNILKQLENKLSVSKT